LRKRTATKSYIVHLPNERGGVVQREVMGYEAVASEMQGGKKGRSSARSFPKGSSEREKKRRRRKKKGSSVQENSDRKPEEPPYTYKLARGKKRPVLEISFGERGKM